MEFLYEEALKRKILKKVQVLSKMVHLFERVKSIEPSRLIKVVLSSKVVQRCSKGLNIP